MKRSRPSSKRTKKETSAVMYDTPFHPGRNRVGLRCCPNGLADHTMIDDRGRQAMAEPDIDALLLATVFCQSWKRINPIKRFHVPCLLPCVDQFTLVLGCPFHDEARRTRRDTAANYGKCIRIDNHLIATVLRVKVRRIVVVVVHFDDDTVKPTKFRHRQTPSDSEIAPRRPFR